MKVFDRFAVFYFMLSQLAIKKLLPGEIALAKQFFLFFQTDDGINNPNIPPDEYIKKLLSKDDFHVIVALENNNVIGGLTAYELEMAYHETKEMFLYEIGVEPLYRKRGIAKELIEFLKNICMEKGITTIFVGTTTVNTAAMKLYESTGGKVEEDTAFFVYELNKV